MLDQLLSGEKDSIISAISSKAGASPEQAGGFLEVILSKIEGLIGAGDLDMASLLKGDLSAITSKLNLGELGAILGGGDDKAKAGIGALLGPLQDKLGGDDAAGLLEGLMGGKSSGGLGGALGGIGKKFGL